MENELIERINKIFPMSEEEIHAFSSRISVKQFNKGDMLIEEGDRVDKVFFIMEGLVRQYILKEGIEKSVFFYVEDEMVRLIDDDNAIPKSSYFLECLEDCTICVAYSRQDDAAFIKKYPRFESLCLILMENIFKQTQHSFEDHIHNSPKDRYLKFLEKRPDLVQRVPQKYLASYLGYTPESLSRIKKRIYAERKPF